MTGLPDDLLGSVASYYGAKLAAHGATSQGVDWNGPESHETRHVQFLRLIGDNSSASVIDLGCGFGDFWRFLRTRGYCGKFTGYDVVPEMVERARALHGEAVDRRWRVGSKPKETADFAAASGIFNVKGDVPEKAWAAYVNDTIEELARAGQRGFAFNMLSLSSDPERRRDNLYYADPAEMLRNCLARYGRSVALLQDYGLYEFTVIVRQAPR